MATSDLRRDFGDLDIYLFDQLLRGRITAGHRILDAGCGGGRNLEYLMREGFDVRAIDQDPAMVNVVRSRARLIAPSMAADRFVVAPVEHIPFGDGAFDVVISSAVLHFARDEAHWQAMVDEMWRVLASGGLLFARLASTIGHETRVRPLGHRRYVVPDGSERFLVDEDFLMQATSSRGGALADPIKTTVVQALRSMTTWVVRTP